MTIADFKLRVAAVVNRDPSLFVVGGVDNLLQAMNDARRSAQRSHAFQLLKSDVFLAVTPAGSNWQTGCKTTPGGATAVTMRQVDMVWNYSAQSLGGSTAYLRTSYVDSGVMGDFRRTLPVYDTQNLIITNQPLWWARQTFWYTQGSNLFVTNIANTSTYLVEGIKFLPDLANGDDPDIFLTYFTDWLVYGTVAALNNYLKASERYAVDNAVMEGLWQSVKQYDGSIANAGQWTNLD